MKVCLQELPEIIEKTIVKGKSFPMVSDILLCMYTISLQQTNKQPCANEEEQQKDMEVPCESRRGKRQKRRAREKDNR